MKVDNDVNPSGVEPARCDFSMLQLLWLVFCGHFGLTIPPLLSSFFFFFIPFISEFSTHVLHHGAHSLVLPEAKGQSVIMEVDVLSEEEMQRLLAAMKDPTTSTISAPALTAIKFGERPQCEMCPPLKRAVSPTIHLSPCLNKKPPQQVMPLASKLTSSLC